MPNGHEYNITGNVDKGDVIRILESVKKNFKISAFLVTFRSLSSLFYIEYIRKEEIEVKKFGVALLSAVLFCTMAAGAFSAKAYDIQPMWDYVTRVTGTIDIASNGTATITADGRAGHSSVTSTALTASLQQFKNGRWQEVKSWNNAASGTIVRLSSKTWPVAHGYSYRVVVTITAYQGSKALESASYTKDYGYFR